MKKYNVAIVGATGLIGSKFISVLLKRNFPINNLKLLASPKSVGKKIIINGNTFVVEGLDENSFKNIDIVFFSAGAEVSKNFAKIADYLDCSVDYLLGRTDDPELHTLKANNKTSEVKLQIPIKKEAPKASEKELQFIRTAASTGNTGMDNGYKAPKQPYSKKDRAEIKKLKDIEDLE